MQKLTLTATASGERKIVFVDDFHRPSWKLGGAGHASFEITKHDGAAWLRLKASETAFAGDGKRDVVREVYMDLNPAAARAFYVRLREMFEAESGEGSNS